MLDRVNSFFNSRIPVIKLEETSWYHQNILELLFFGIIDNFRKKIHSERTRESESSFDKVYNVLIIFLILFVISSPFLVLNLVFLQNDILNLSNNLLQLGVILFFGSISWTLLIYLSLEFKNLIQAKIFYLTQNRTLASDFLNFMIKRFFGGFYFEWPSNRGIRIYLRSAFFLVPTIGGIVILYGNLYIASISAAIFNFNILEAALFLVKAMPYFMISFIVFTLFFIGTTSFLIFLILLLAVLKLPLEIKPFVEMGDTKQFGELLVRWLYLTGFVFGIYPLLSFMNYVDLNNLPFSQISYLINKNQTLGNLTQIVKVNVDKSITEIPISGIMNNIGLIVFILIFILLAFIIVFALHYRIKHKKNAELKRLELNMSNFNFSQIDNSAQINRYQFYLSQYEAVLALYEWPIKKLFVIEILIAISLLFIPRLF